MILALRTDQPEAELYLLKNNQVVTSQKWPAHRHLSDTLLEKVEQLLNSQKLPLNQLTGLVVFQGPGSFTGLRIGISFMNALAYSLKLPIAAATGANWLNEAIDLLKEAKPATVILPHYGSEVHITKQRK